MIIERSMQQDWLSNAYLVGDEENGKAVVIDSGGPSEPLLEAAERHGLDVELLLLTHHHGDHVAENSVWKERHGVEIVAHPVEAELVDQVDRTIGPGDTIEVGGLKIESIHTPGHTAGMLNFLVNGTDIFTGDTLFKGSVGGVRAPGSTSFEDLRHSIMDVLMKLPHETRVHPGHTDPTTIGEEWEQNAFVRVWRGLDDEGGEACTVEGEEAGSGEPAEVLKRFVVPAARVSELPEEMPPLSVVLPDAAGAAQLEGDERVRAVELRLAGARPRSADLLAAYRSLEPLDVTTYFELVFDDAWRDSVPAAIGAVAAVGGRVKVRCGGEHVPSVEQLALVVACCREAGVRFKATAGLHRAVRRGGGDGVANP